LSPKGQREGFKTLQSLTNASGLETHGITLDYDVFENLQKPIQAAKSDKPSPVYFGVDLNFKLNPKGKAVDAGVIIPNVNDYFRQKAPDLGALEVGSPAIIYGVRGLKQDQEFWR
jgi:hypothetical protein